MFTAVQSYANERVTCNAFKTRITVSHLGLATAQLVHMKNLFGAWHFSGDYFFAVVKTVTSSKGL